MIFESWSQIQHKISNLVDTVTICTSRTVVTNHTTNHFWISFIHRHQVMFDLLDYLDPDPDSAPRSWSQKKKIAERTLKVINSVFLLGTGSRSSFLISLDLDQVLNFWEVGSGSGLSWEYVWSGSGQYQTGSKTYSLNDSNDPCKSMLTHLTRFRCYHLSVKQKNKWLFTKRQFLHSLKII